MPDVHSPEQRSYNMSRIRGKDTKPEKLLRSLLYRSGYRFRLNVANLPGKPDIVLPKYKTVIFVHGCFWHRHRNCRYTTTPIENRERWQAKFSRNVERDQENQEALKKLGWIVIIVWECELKHHKDSVLKQIINKLLKVKPQ